MKILILGLLITLFLPKSQAASFHLGERVCLDSQILSQTRELQILLPENYYENNVSNYPVIYLLDGDYNFHGISGMLDLLANKGQLIPDVILVAIADKGTSQYRQLMTPVELAVASSSSPAKGALTPAKHAAEFLRFLTDEVKPYVAENYRSAEHSILVGQSMGGLFVLNALIESPDAFKHYVAISPSVWVAEQGIVKKAKEKLGKNAHQPVSLFLSLADETRMGQYDFINLLDINEPKNIDWSFKHYPDENHNSVGLIALRDSLKALYSQWYIAEKDLTKFTNPEDIVKHYQNVMTKHAFKQAMPSASIKAMVRHYYRHNNVDKLPVFIAQTSEKLPESRQALIAMQASYAGHFDSPKAALELLLSVENLYPNSIDHLKAIASTYEQVGDMLKAKSYYQKALTVAKKYNTNQWQLNILEAKIAVK
ncbi:alpha/beta hydrolase [Colwellia sp. D2M02]|uniref:alpha/beta hydrolase n=1 Tax=Colwellia sp. D2M02 TaxID=2841562 RepID=UPI001C091A73|nr:alpha/beta hydrolase-fold protein [Colwellia sp. D2M02]MBU2894929.1 alpha/beta hydrolase [Colwellia sp. D2M02]